MTHERLSRLLIGLTIFAGLGLEHLGSPLGGALMLVVAINLVLFAVTGRCVIKRLLDHIGVPYERPPEHLIAEKKLCD